MKYYNCLVFKIVTIIISLGTISFTNIAAQSKSINDTITVLSFNDFHGAFVEDAGIPGAGVFAQTILDLKKKCPNSIVVSGGDNFSGSYFTRLTRGEPLAEMYKILGVKLSTLGNHEFDWGFGYLVDTISKDINFISSNVKLKNTCKSPDWLKPYDIVDVNIDNNNKIRIAFIGLTTCETPYKTSVENTEGLEFIHPLAAVTEQLINLKEEEKRSGKIDMIILLCHLGTYMDIDGLFEECNSLKLPYLENIDAIITAHSHEVVYKTINNIPIIQSGRNGKYVGKLQFLVKKGKKDKDYSISFIKGENIKVDGNANAEVVNLVDAIVKKDGLDEILTIAKDDFIHDRTTNKFEYTTIGAIVSSAYKYCYEKEMNIEKNTIVLGMNHYGGLRTSIAQGEVTRLEAGNVLPFGNYIVAYNFDGKRLKQLLNDGRTNKNGFLQTSFLKFKCNKDNTIDKIFYTKDDNNIEITDNTPCIIVLDAYITDGGDGYNADLFTGFEIEKFNHKKILTDQCFINYLKTFKNISSKDVAIPYVE